MTVPKLGALAVAAVLTAGATACGASTSASSDPNTFVVIDAQELGDFNPLLGHGKNSESKIYESLYRVDEGVSDHIPTPVPVLAESAPKPVAGDLSTWTVTTRKGVKFSDGTPFGPDDVAATYNSVINPAYASTIAADYDFLKAVRKTGPNTVEFDLKQPYAELPQRLYLAIAPARSLRAAEPADKSPLNSHPIGTGPYKLDELRADQATLSARPDYWGAKPGVKKFIVRRTDDDNARATQLRDGADATVLPPELAPGAARDGYTVVKAKTDDWRGVTLPSANPVSGDPAVRLALNYAVDRDAMVKSILGGAGEPNSTLFGTIYGNAYDPKQDFAHDTVKAGEILDKAGWKAGSDGVRSKKGQRATFDLSYYPTDKVRRDLTLATVSDAKKVGIEINPVAVDKETMTAPYIAKTPFLLGGGGEPYTVDGQLYTKFHSRFAKPGVGSKWDNASDYVNPKIDALLDKARTEPDESKRAQLYRQFQAQYRAAPAMLALVTINHVYVYRSNGWKVPDTALEPHTHGTDWGPWYSLARWTR